MSRVWVVNASPVILLGKIGRVALLGHLSDQLIVSAVLPGSRAVLDDLAARRCAQAIGCPLIGTLGVVLRARRRGVIERARPVIEELRNAGLYASDSLIEQALTHLGE